jgi:hypothetical protein
LVLVGLAMAALLCAVLALPSSAEGSSVGSGRSKTATPSMFPATGYFRVAEKSGHWYMVTPQGGPFYASAIDTVTAQGDTDQVTGQCPYCEAVAADYPTIGAWDSATLSRLRTWGFNTLGSFSDDTSLGSRMPFEVQLSMASGDDWFAQSFVTNADQVAETQVAPLADDPNLVGYFTDTELTWGPPGTGSHTTLLDKYLALPAGSPGLAVAKEYVGNPDGFLTAIATRYFKVTTAAIRKYDTHHLILGAKAEGQEVQPQLLEAASHYINVFSLEDYDYSPGLNAAVQKAWPFYLPITQNLADFEQYFKGPLLIGEYSFLAKGPQDPNTVPGIYTVAPTQQIRASNFESFIAPLYEEAPWVVGDNWFEFVDEPAGGRTGDHENNDFGMVNVENQPYPTMTAAMELMHSMTPAQLIQSGRTCDSWAESDGSVTCQVTVPHVSYSPTIVTRTLLAGKVNDPYSSGVFAAGGTPPYTYRIAAGSLPPGIKLASTTGWLTGTPKAAGTFSFTVRATSHADPAGVTQKLSLLIDPLPLAVKATSLGSGRVGVAYTKVLKASGGTSPYSWSIASGSLPTGLTLNRGGDLQGTPSTAGTFDFTVKVEDSTTKPLTASSNLSMVIKAQ